MKRMLALGVAAILLGAQTRPPPQTVGVIPAGKVVLGYCQLSVSTAVSLSSCSNGIPSGAAFFYATPETASVRWRDDGVAPTASVGYPLAPPSQLVYSGNIGAIQFIAQSGTSTLNVAFYR